MAGHLDQHTRLFGVFEVVVPAAADIDPTFTLQTPDDLPCVGLNCHGRLAVMRKYMRTGSRRQGLKNGPKNSIAAHDRQLALPPIEKAHDPSSRLAAIVLVRIVSAGAASPSSKVTLAVSLSMQLGPLLPVGHGPRLPWESFAVS